jgi:hypothetical protein
MNTNTRAPQVKHLTLFFTVLLRYLTVSNSPSTSVIHNAFTCEALSARRIISPFLKTRKPVNCRIDFMEEIRKLWPTKRFRDAVSSRDH